MNEYSRMLLESAKKVYEIVQKPECTDENKILIASANTLAQTTKTAIQLELLQNNAYYSKRHTDELIHKVNK